MNKEDEKLLFQRFEKRFENMPQGVADFPDVNNSIDVIFNVNGGEKIGIELTELIYDEILMNTSERQNRFTKQVVDSLKNKIHFKFMLDIVLDPKVPINGNHWAKIIDETVEICSSEFQDIESLKSKRLDQLDVNWEEMDLITRDYFYNQGFRKLPAPISNIKLSRFDVLDNSTYSSSKSGFVPDLTNQGLHSFLKKKEKKIKGYQKCDKYWLVLIEGKDFYSSYKSFNINGLFDTSFDKVFIFRSFDNDVIVLK